MNTPPPTTPDPWDMYPGDADQRMLDALLSTTGESDQARQTRIERVLVALDEQQQPLPEPEVVGRIGFLPRLVPAGMVAAILVTTTWALWPRHGVETAQAAIVRVSASLRSVDHRRYEVIVSTADGRRLHGTVDIASGDRFVSLFSPTGEAGDSFTIIAGSDGSRHWLIPPFGPVLVSDKPFGPLIPIARDGDGVGAPLLSLPRAISALGESHDMEFADIDDSDLMRFVTTRKQDGSGSDGTSDRPVLSTADVIARRDSGEVVQARFMLDHKFFVGSMSIRSIVFRLQPDAGAPSPEWYEHTTHHSGSP